MTSHSWPEVLSALIARTDLDASQAAWAMDQILAGEATPSQIAGFAVALRTKGETIEELSGLVDAMYAHAVPLSLEGRWLDIVGTGGDRSMSVNISTMSSIVAAGAGAPVVKHGNRSASSKSGAADVLEALGVRLDVKPSLVAEMAARCGIAFCFAPAFHPALRHAAVPRKELGVGTTFNFLGPLANPARPAAQAIGCADVRMAPLMAGVYAARGVDAWVFRGDDGLDELTTTTTSQGVGGGGRGGHHLHGRPRGGRPGPQRPRRTCAAATPPTTPRSCAGWSPATAGPVRDAVLLNAGAALAVLRPRQRRPGRAAAGRDGEGGGVGRLRQGRRCARGVGVLERGAHRGLTGLAQSSRA